MVKSSTERTDAAIPEALRQIGEVIRASGAAHTTTARSLVAYYGEERRGDVVVERIRADLALLGLVARPDFELAYIDAEIELVPAAAGTDASSGDDVASGTDAVLPGALTTRAGAADPVVRIGMLRAANHPPVAVSRTDPVRRAVTLMLLHDFSQLPVLHGDRRVDGMITWRSIGRAMELARPCVTVGDCLEDAPVVWDDEPLLDAVGQVARHAAVLVRRRRDDLIVGLVTTSDISLEFLARAEPFLLLGQVERQLRRLLDGRVTRDQAVAANALRGAAAVASSLDALTFGAYVRLLEAPATWEQVGLCVDRGELCARLRFVNQIRNRVMHFNPDGPSPDDVQALRLTVAFLDEVCPERTAPEPSERKPAPARRATDRAAIRVVPQQATSQATP